MKNIFKLTITVLIIAFIILGCSKEEKYDNFNNRLINKETKQLNLSDSTNTKMNKTVEDSSKKNR